MPGVTLQPPADPPSPSPSQWHQINPSTRPLNLQILELTPLSLTLSLALLGPGKQLRGLKSQPKRRRRSDDEVSEEQEPVSTAGSFKHLLSHGVVVTVNGQAWSRIVAHVAEAPEEQSVQKDRAVVVVYGLLPGVEYEVELRVVGLPLGGSEDEVGIASTTVLIPPGPTGSRSRANSLRSRSHPRSRSNSTSLPDHPLPTAAPAVQPPTQTIDAQAAHLRHLVSATNAERDGLLAQIKETRRASQRAEAALRQEVETIKKSSEKLSAADLRARQKTLALQEQVKQAWAASEHAEQETIRVEESMGEIENEERKVAKDVEGVQAEVKASDEKDDAAKEKDRKARAEADKTLTDITNKVEKLRVKRDKRQSEREELEKKLADLIHQREEQEGRNEMEMQRRRTTGLTGAHFATRPGWDDPTWQVGYPAHQERSLSAQPSLNNISAAAASSSGYRSRVTSSHFQTRYPPASTAPVGIPGGRPPATASAAPVGSPTHGGFFRPGPGPTQQRSTSNPGVNVAAPPFHPTFSGPNTDQHTTSLVPPQLQHRIYLPSVRPPRPTPTFHPPPGVASQVASSPGASTDSPPTAFPPLPSQHSAVATTSVSPVAKAATPSGPSLASIVTRAVLSPYSGVLNQPQHTSQSSSASSSSNGLQSRRASYQRPSPPPSNSGSSGPPSRQPSVPVPLQSPLTPTFATSPGQVNQTPKGNPAMPSRIWGVPDEYPRPASPGIWGSGGPWPGAGARIPTPPVEEGRNDEDGL